MKKCPICDCYVGVNERARIEHESGIKHRRLSLSLQHGHGTRIVSIFEDVSKLGRKKNSQAKEGQLAAEQRVILAHLLSVSSQLNLYQRALALLTSTENSAPAFELRPSNTLSLDLASISAASCFSLKCQDTHMQKLMLSVPFRGYGAVAASQSASLSVLISRLRTHSTLQSIEFRFTKGDYIELLAQSGPGIVGAQFQHLWKRGAIEALSTLVASRPCLRSLIIEAPPHLLSPSSILKLNVATRESTQNARDCRMCVLLCSSKGDCPLSFLPSCLLHVILEEALPLTPCEIEWPVTQWLPDDDSSSSSSEEDGDSSSEDDQDGRQMGGQRGRWRGRGRGRASGRGRGMGRGSGVSDVEVVRKMLEG